MIKHLTECGAELREAKHVFRTSESSLPELERRREAYSVKRNKILEILRTSFYEKAAQVGFFYGYRKKRLYSIRAAGRAVGAEYVREKTALYYRLLPDWELPLHVTAKEPFLTIVKNRLEGNYEPIPERQDLVDEYALIENKLRRINMIISYYDRFIKDILRNLLDREVSCQYGLAQFLINGRLYLIEAESKYGTFYTPDSICYKGEF